MAHCKLLTVSRLNCLAPNETRRGIFPLRFRNPSLLTRTQCPWLLRKSARRQRLADVSWSNIKAYALPGIQWSRTPWEALRLVMSRIWPSRDAGVDLRHFAAHHPGASTVPWYGLSRGARILRWFFSPSHLVCRRRLWFARLSATSREQERVRAYLESPLMRGGQHCRLSVIGNSGRCFLMLASAMLFTEAECYPRTIARHPRVSLREGSVGSACNLHARFEKQVLVATLAHSLCQPESGLRVNCWLYNHSITVFY
jgi:hypothetical protein